MGLHSVISNCSNERNLRDLLEGFIMNAGSIYFPQSEVDEAIRLCREKFGSNGENTIRQILRNHGIKS